MTLSKAPRSILRYSVAISLAILALPLSGSAQEKKVGLKFTPAEELAGIPLASAPFSGQELPAMVDLSAKLPPPGNQGNQNSCVAWTLAYAVKSYQEFVEEGIPLVSGGSVNKARVFSPAFIYNQINQGLDGGSFFKDGLNILSSQGAATLASMPYNETDYLTKPSASIKQEAKRYRIDYWRQVNFHDGKEVKAQLNAGYPVIVGAMVDAGFRSLGQGETWKERKGQELGGHAMLVVGYDDNRSAFKLLNSWGKEWGSNGFAWVSYSFFPSIVREAYVAKDAINGAEPVGPNPTPSPGPTYVNTSINFQVTGVQHNVMIPGLGPCMQINGTAMVPAGTKGRAQVVVQIYRNDGFGGKGPAVGSLNFAYATIHGQAATATSPVLLPPAGLNNTWTVNLPYLALNVPKGAVMTPFGLQGVITTYLVAEPILFIDNFGVSSSIPFPFTVGL